MAEPNAPQPLAISLHQLLKMMVEKQASDLLISMGTPPQLRVDGSLIPIKVPPLLPPDTKQLVYSILTDAQKHRFEEDLELDLSFGVKDLSRFRANVYMQRGAVSAAFRMIPFKIIDLEQLGLPPIVKDLTRQPRGLVLVTGPTGSGKSTTLASMVDLINTERHEHIITIEDPIEYLHPNKSCVVDQREIGTDTMSFKRALKYVLRQNPDVVLIGEMRDLETVEAALSVAETGHLCLATLHTNSCVQTINRIIDIFPAHQQAQVRTQLSFVLEAVISQTLLPRHGAAGRVLAYEIMIPNPAIRSNIREDKTQMIYSTMQSGQGKHGMSTMNQSLASLHIRGLISIEDALGHSSDHEELQRMINERTGARK